MLQQGCALAQGYGLGQAWHRKATLIATLMHRQIHGALMETTPKMLLGHTGCSFGGEGGGSRATDCSTTGVKTQEGAYPLVVEWTSLTTTATCCLNRTPFCVVAGGAWVRVRGGQAPVGPCEASTCAKTTAAWAAGGALQLWGTHTGRGQRDPVAQEALAYSPLCRATQLANCRGWGIPPKRLH